MKKTDQDKTGQKQTGQKQAGQKQAGPKDGDGDITAEQANVAIARAAGRIPAIQVMRDKINKLAKGDEEAAMQMLVAAIRRLLHEP
jgi:hypothetical protein